MTNISKENILGLVLRNGFEGTRFYMDNEYYIVDRRNLDTTKIIEDDIITIYGEYAGLAGLTRAINDSTEYVPGFYMYLCDIEDINPDEDTGDTAAKLGSTKETMYRAWEYMSDLGKAFDVLSKKKVSEAALKEYVSMLLPVAGNSSQAAEKNVFKQSKDIILRYKYAPDLKDMPQNGYRFINAVSDFATHSKPLHETKKLQGNPFQQDN